LLKGEGRGTIGAARRADRIRRTVVTYLVFKLLHLACVVAFMGNITIGVFWHKHAEQTRDPKLLAYVMDGIIASDRYFTVPGVIGIIITGVITAHYGHFPLLRTGWILWTLILFGISGLVFMLRVAPLQRQLKSLAEGAFNFAAYRATARRWELWGAIALLTPLAGMVLMVLKPI
jgi:uncharacterized membrane protein